MAIVRGKQNTAPSGPYLLLKPIVHKKRRLEMTRVKLVLPEKFLFSTDIQVRISDINYGNHLGNDAVLALVHEARLQCLKAHGFSELDVGGRGLMLTDAIIVYKSQGFYGDVLVIHVAIADFNKYGCDFFFKIERKDNGREIARAKTGIVFFDYAKQKIATVPDVFSATFRDVN
jgi:acyl-CoA thioesterase FadM